MGLKDSFAIAPHEKIKDYQVINQQIQTVGVELDPGGDYWITVEIDLDLLLPDGKTLVVTEGSYYCARVKAK